MAHHREEDGRDGLQIWRVVAKTFNKQSRTVYKGWSSRLGVGRGAKTTHHFLYEMLHRVSNWNGVRGRKRGVEGGEDASLNVIRMMTSRRIRRTENLARMCEMRNAY
jgi:hypothetical protein